MKLFWILAVLALPTLAADVSGIWTGFQDGPRGEKQDVAFRFRVSGDQLAGTLFGDEFDLPIGDGSTSNGKIRFTITTTNYYSGRKIMFTYTGSIKGDEMELVRERIPAPDDSPAIKQASRSQTVVLQRIR